MNINFCIDRHNISKLVGKVPNVTKFDASFFGINYKQAHIMDPMCRLLLERVYEAIVDAG
jgi:fatty acid synthase